MEVESDVKTVMVHYACDDCGGNVQSSNDRMLLTDPPKFEHHCADCEKKYMMLHRYPYMRHVQT